MTTKHTFGLAMLLLGSYLPAQTSKSYTAVDLDSGDPIAYATISLANQPEQRTLSNENGGFSLPSHSSTDTLVFSHVSYGQPRVAVADILGDTIRLRARDFTLDEVAIISETGEEILRKVIKAIKKNHDFDKTAYFAQSWVTVTDLNGRELHAFFELDGSTLWQQNLMKHTFAEMHTRTRSWTDLGKAWLKETTVNELVWGSYYVGGGMPSYLLERPRKAFENFNVDIAGTYQAGDYSVIRLELTPKQSPCATSYTLHIDMDSYAIMRSQTRSNVEEYRNISEYGCPFHPDFKIYRHEHEERFIEIDGTWHRLYLKVTTQRFFQGQDIITEEFNLSQITEWDTAKQENASQGMADILNAWMEPIAAFTIPWEDPYWQSRPSVPWPDWVAERLEAEGLAR